MKEFVTSRRLLPPNRTVSIARNWIGYLLCLPSNSRLCKVGGVDPDDPIPCCDWGCGGTAGSVFSVPPFLELFSRAKNFRPTIGFDWVGAGKERYNNPADDRYQVCRAPAPNPGHVGARPISWITVKALFNSTTPSLPSNLRLDFSIRICVLNCSGFFSRTALNLPPPLPEHQRIAPLRSHYIRPASSCFFDSKPYTNDRH